MHANSTSSLSDAELVSAARQGRSGAFDALVERYFGLVYVVAYSRLAAREPAEDLAQEVFLKAFLHLDKLQSPTGFVGWIRSMARNLAIDWIRKGRASSELVSMVEAETKVDRLPDLRAQGAREAMEAQETRQMVHAAIHRLPPDLRELVFLHYLGELSKSEVARQLGLHPATVGRKLKRALRELRDILEPVVRDSVRESGPRPGVMPRTLALVAAAAALSPAAKAAVVTAAGSGLSLSSATGAAGASAASAGSASVGTASGGAVAAGTAGKLTAWLHSLPTILSVGGQVMGIGKGIAIAVGAVVVLGGGVYYYTARTSSPAVVPSGGAAPADTAGPVASAPASSIASNAAPVPRPTLPPPAPSNAGYDKWAGMWFCQSAPELQSSLYMKVGLRADRKPEFQMSQDAASLPRGDVSSDLLARFPNLLGASVQGGANLPTFSPVQEMAPGRIAFQSERPDVPLTSTLEYRAEVDSLSMTLTTSQQTPQGKVTETTMGPWSFARWQAPPDDAGSGTSDEQLISAGLSDARRDQRACATALEAHFVDFNQYPAPGPDSAVPLILTTPVGYISRLASDPFASAQNATYRYYVSANPPAWILVSPGPDGDFDITPEIFQDAARRTPPGQYQEMQRLLEPYTYSPVNGTISNGDVFRFKQ